jgi:hypothetical protein
MAEVPRREWRIGEGAEHHHLRHHVRIRRWTLTGSNAGLREAILRVPAIAPRGAIAFAFVEVPRLSSSGCCCHARAHKVTGAPTKVNVETGAPF